MDSDLHDFLNNLRTDRGSLQTQHKLIFMCSDNISHHS